MDEKFYFISLSFTRRVNFHFHSDSSPISTSYTNSSALNYCGLLLSVFSFLEFTGTAVSSASVFMEQLEESAARHFGTVPYGAVILSCVSGSVSEAMAVSAY